MVTDTTFEVDLYTTWDMFRGLASIVDFGEVYTNLNSAREIWINVCTYIVTVDAPLPIVTDHYPYRTRCDTLRMEESELGGLSHPSVIKTMLG